MSNLNSRAHRSLACEQYSVHYLHLVVGVLTTSHQREGVFATYEPSTITRRHCIAVMCAHRMKGASINNSELHDFPDDCIVVVVIHLNSPELHRRK